MMRVLIISQGIATLYFFFQGQWDKATFFAVIFYGAAIIEILCKERMGAA